MVSSSPIPTSYLLTQILIVSYIILSMQPSCQQHPQRKVQVICFSSNCPLRLTLQCTKCLNSSKCKKHNWKMVQDFIQQIFQVCQTLQAKHQKKQQPQPKLNSKITKSRLMIDEIVKSLSERIDKLKQRVIAAAEEHGMAIVKSLEVEKPEENFRAVKSIVNNFRREETRTVGRLDGILAVLREMVECDEDGQLSLREVEGKREKEEQVMHDSSMAGVEDFREHTNRIMENLEVFIESHDGKDRFDKERKALYAHIEELNEQVKHIPVLKQRIEDQGLKIEAKEKKIRKFEAELGGGSKPAENKPQPKGGAVVNKQEADKQARIARIQKLLEVRQVAVRMAVEHTQNCNKQSLKTFKLSHDQNGYAMDIGTRPCQKAAMINFSIIAVNDELNFLRHSEKVEGQLNVQLLVKNQVSVNTNPFFDILMGGVNFR